MLFEAQIIAFIGAFLLLGAFWQAHRRFPSDFSGYWIVGWSFYVLRLSLDAVQTVFGESLVISFATNLALATSAVLILLGVLHLTGRKQVYTREAWVLWGLLVVWSGIAAVFDIGFFGTYTPLYFAFGGVTLVTAYHFYQYLKEYDYSSTPLIIGSLVLWGLHKFDYPFLRPIEEVAFYGYIFAALLSFTTGLGVMMFLLEDAERKATKERNAANRRFEEFQALFDTIPDPVYIHDFDGNFLRVNETAIESLGYSESRLHTMQARDIVSPEEKTAVEDRITLAAETESITFDSTHVTADGKTIDVAVNATKITYEGEPAILAVARDVTDRQLLEQRLSVVNRILRHDIRSAVNIIKGNAEIAMTTDGRSTGPLQTVMDEADHLYDIAETAQKIERLQDASQSSKELVDILPLVESKVLSFRNQYPDATIRSNVPEDLRAEVAVGFDEAIENVLQNAIEHNDSAEPTVTVTVQSTPENVTIRVADNGPGIPEAEIRPIQAGEETALHHTSGLGLWFVYWILEESGGKLEFEDNDPRGAIVDLVVRRADAASNVSS